MEKIVEVYVKTVIAVLGFIAPTVTLLLPVLDDRIERLKSRLKQEEANFEEISKTLEADISRVIKGTEATTPALQKTIRESIDRYLEDNRRTFERSIIDLKAKIKDLDLKRQIRRIFVNLILTLLLICIFYVVRADFWGYLTPYKKYIIPLESGILLISLILFARALFIIWRLVCLMLDGKPPANILPNTDGNVISNTPNT